MAKPEERLATLLQEKSSLLLAMKNLKNHVEADNRMTAAELDCRAQVLDAHFRQASQIQSNIERLDPENKEREILDEFFISTKAAILSSSSKLKRERIDDTSFLNSTSSQSHHTRLPSLKLPKFDGKYSEYSRFMTAFTHLVDDDVTINPVDKFNYPLSCLSDTALSVVSSFQVSEDNYPKAMNRLKERYDKKVLIFLEHISSLCALPIMEPADANSLRGILDTVSALRGSLLSLGSETDILNAILIHNVLLKVDSDARQAYNRSQDYDTLPSWDNCYKTLSRHSEFLDCSAPCINKERLLEKRQEKPTDKRHGNLRKAFVAAQNTCLKCKSTDHNIGKCPSFAALTVDERFNIAKQLSLCINCLGKGHMAGKCSSKFKCRVCRGLHHTCLHRYTQVITASQPMDDISQADHCTTHAVSLLARQSKRALIPTAVVLIKDNCGSYQQARALLDSGSEINFITEELAKRLQLTRVRQQYDICGIADARAKMKFSVTTSVKSRIGHGEWLLEFAITKSITQSQPESIVETNGWKLPVGIELADPFFYKPSKIDILISIQEFFGLLGEGKISLGPNLPYLQKSSLGWLLGGRIDEPRSVKAHAFMCKTESVRDLNVNLQRFWEIEELSTERQALTEEEEACENHFNSQVTVLASVAFRHALSADISKMYRQFMVHPDDRKFQLIFWRSSGEQPLKIYQLNTVTYGMACAPFLAIRSLQFIAQRKQEQYPVGASVLLEDMYVDDLLTGADSIEELQQKVFEVNTILEDAGLALAKWNASHLIETNTEFHIKPNGDNVTKALGMSWKPLSDVFCFRYALPSGGEITKRRVISILARLYDVLGLLSPVVVRCKIFAQQLWLQGFGWDDTLPSNLNVDWHRIESDLQNVNQVEIPRFLKCFIANRVSRIQEQSVDVTWRHVPGKSNPADIVSCGCAASELSDTIWFSGPEFLRLDPEFWPQSPPDCEFDDLYLEKRKAVSFACSSIQSTDDKPKIADDPHLGSVMLEIVNRTGSYRRILRIVAYVLRVFNRVPANRKFSVQDAMAIAPTELNQAFTHIVAAIHNASFSKEISQLAKNQEIKDKTIRGFSPYLSQVEVGTYTLTVLRDHDFTWKFVNHLHRTNMHAGAKALVGLLRLHIWVANAKKLASSVVRQCVHCYHYKPRLANQIMGSLPSDRLQTVRPFTVTGVDLCGPFLTSYRIRSKVQHKTYLAIYVCFSSKAVHIELLSDLSTNTFILSLKRFVSRRGSPCRIYCDNATNFTGASVQLNRFKQELFSQQTKQDLETFSNDTGVEFCFIPPRAPHFGGLWEAAVKSMKNLLIKCMSDSGMTYEELQTIAIGAEAILNSRPIAGHSEDPNDGEALTPGHLLTAYTKRRLWDLWRRDYLHTLQMRAKWTSPIANLEPGQIVLIHEDNSPPQHWLTGRIINSISGEDNKVRVVNVQTAKGVIRRPICKIAPLPIQYGS
ncbi:uncharacterized protein [Drosophila takahashii]|uniref:uncharacterized protein n=1 Tax=Drosophila takahashii TaxID=29030 RepID=UPI003898DBEE